MATKTESKKIVGYKTVTLNMASWHDPKYIFTMGKKHTIAGAKKDGQPCGPGLHFCENKEDLDDYNGNPMEHIVLQVEADAYDVLGRDNTKTRVKSLTITKELSRVERFSKDFYSVFEKCKKIIPLLGKPKALMSAQRAEALAKQTKAKSVRLISNMYEVEHWVNATCLELELPVDYDVTDKVSEEMTCDLNIHDKETGFSFDFSGNIVSALGFYCEQLSDAKSKRVAEATAYVEFLKAGCVPIGLNSKNTLLVFQPAVVKPVVKKTSKKPSKKVRK